ncbi:MAG: 50S ribosomal protein L23 [Candidatus Bathyarchaeota archaeon]
MVNRKQVILYPLITEDAVNLIENENKLVFIVNLHSNKKSIKKNVEELYTVKVEKVTYLITSKGQKKAFVKLTPEFKASDIAIKLGIF